MSDEAGHVLLILRNGGQLAYWRHLRRWILYGYCGSESTLSAVVATELIQARYIRSGRTFENCAWWRLTPAGTEAINQIDRPLVVAQE